MAATAEAPPKPASVTPAARSSAAGWFDVPTNRYIALGAAAVLVVIVAWFLVLAGRRKEEFANRALEQARAMAESGNLPLAASEMQKVITTYGGTRSGQEAVIMLNQVRLVNGQHELAAVSLQDFLKAGPSAEFRGPAQGLLGRALENASRPADAAQAYATGAEVAEVDYLRTELLLDAARAYVIAGDRDKAMATYRRIIKDFPDTPSRTEAEIRLAELTGGQP